MNDEQYLDEIRMSFDRMEQQDSGTVLGGEQDSAEQVYVSIGYIDDNMGRRGI